jgi:hypothetical protein
MPDALHQSSIRLPRPLWCGVATGVLIVLGLGVRIGVPAYRQQAAIQEVERVGGELLSRPLLPEWFRKKLNNPSTACFDRPFLAYLEESSATDETLAALSHLTSIELLVLGKSQITDDGMDSISRLINLEELDLSNTSITDAGLARLTALPKLRRLFLFGTQVSDAGLAHLARHTELESVSLSDPRISDEGMRHLAACPNLTSIFLSSSRVTDAGVFHLKRLEKLDLTALKNLQYVDLSRTQVTNAGLAYVTEFPKLESIYLEGSQVTDDALKELQQKYPRLIVRRYGCLTYPIEILNSIQSAPTQSQEADLFDDQPEAAEPD